MRSLVLLVLIMLIAACTTEKRPQVPDTAAVGHTGPCGYGAYSVVTLNDSTAKALGFTQVCAQEAIGSGETKVTGETFKNMIEGESELTDYPFVEYHRYQ